MKPTLYILAAGMGSRYGGLKQLDSLGPGGETIMDYSVYDAIRAGFGKIVFVIRHDFEDDFRKKILSKYEGKIDVEVVFQELSKLPEGYTPNKERTKPWGTGHAVLMAKEVIREPFGVINADDYYGAESFSVLADFLRSVEGQKGKYAMVGFRIENTLSENGGVSRGICEVSSDGFLTGVTERHEIQRRADGTIVYVDTDGSEHVVPEGTNVSMNMWGFTPDYFDYSQEEFIKFLDAHGDELKSEFYIPTVVNNLINSGEATLAVMETPSKWFGVTFAADHDATVAQFKDLVDKGVYPPKLF
ncbi:MAG: nucleotidyltransferase [Bacteroides sp.]|nr:nucleotidyltransferase [Bacteroides sp.]